VTGGDTSFNNSDIETLRPFFGHNFAEFHHIYHFEDIQKGFTQIGDL